MKGSAVLQSSSGRKIIISGDDIAHLLAPLPLEHILHVQADGNVLSLRATALVPQALSLAVVAPARPPSDTLHARHRRRR